MNKVADRRISQLTIEQHKQIILDALESPTLHPGVIGWHYLQVAFQANNCNISDTARAVKLPRRTVQRALDKRWPL